MDTWFPTFRRFAKLPPHANQSWSSWPWYTTASQRWSLLRLIAVSLEENLPLVPLLENWAEDESGVQQRRIRRLVQLLRSGRLLPDALEEVPQLLGEEDVLAVRFDAQLGTRTAAVRQVLDEHADVAGQPALRVGRALLYFCTVVPIGLMAIIFAQIKIVPIFERMFNGFGIAPSPLMHGPAYLLAPLTMAGGAGFFAVVVLLVLLFGTWRGRAFRGALLGRWFRSIQELRAADVLQKIAIAVGAGRPIAGALSTLARYHFDPTTRQKLLFARNEIEQGAEVWHSLVAVNILAPPEANLLRTSEITSNRCWILRQLVNAKRRRTWWRLQRYTVFAMPAVVLALGLLVLLQSLSMFEPLVRLIESQL